MRIEIEIPKEFEKHFAEDKFKDSLERIMADIKHSLQNGDFLCAGKYEHETIEMLENAFENSRQAYDIEKVIKELETKENETILKAPNTSDITNPEYQKWMMKSYGFKEAIEIVKRGYFYTEEKSLGNDSEEELYEER